MSIFAEASIKISDFNLMNSLSFVFFGFITVRLSSRVFSQTNPTPGMFQAEEGRSNTASVRSTRDAISATVASYAISDATRGKKNALDNRQWTAVNRAGMARKVIIVLLVGLALASVRIAEAQQAKKVARIGFLSGLPLSTPCSWKGCAILVMWTRKLLPVGGFMSCGVSVADLFRRAATYVDKILKGAKPADLPVEQPTKFEFRD
jgi:hypothetical protein